MNIKSGVAFATAFVLSVETIFVESLTTVLQISPLTIAASSTPLAGAMLLLIVAVKMKGKITIFKSWRHLLLGSTFMALGIISWYDSVSRIGASKEATLTGPLESTVVLFLAWFLLKERLSKVQLVGSMIAIGGILAAANSGNALDASSSFLFFSIGDIEAMLSAISFAVAVIFLTRLVAFHSSMEVAGGSLLISGLILAAFQLSYYPEIVTQQEWALVLLYSFLPLIGALLYTMSLRKIGASITSIITSSSYLLTIITQFALAQFGLRAILPENLLLLVIGALLGVVGIILIHDDAIMSFRSWLPQFRRELAHKERKDE